jgi:hypothetical protein
MGTLQNLQGFADNIKNNLNDENNTERKDTHAAR